MPCYYHCIGKTIIHHRKSMKGDITGSILKPLGKAISYCNALHAGVSYSYKGAVNHREGAEKLLKLHW